MRMLDECFTWCCQNKRAHKSWSRLELVVLIVVVAVVVDDVGVVESEE